MSYQSTNPANGKKLQTFAETTDWELEAALQSAAACFEVWRAASFTERATVANKAAEILRSRIDEFSRPVTLEMGKRFEEAQAEVRLSADINHPTWTAVDLPFGGIKNSGYGRELSRLGIQEFVNKKLVRTQVIEAPV